MSRRATALSRGDAGQSGVAAMSVVVNLVAIELAFQIALIPKQSLIDVFAPDGPDQALDESMRPGCAGDRLDLINLKDSKVCQPTPKTKQRIVIRGEMSRHALSRDGAVEHPADAGSVEIGGGDAKANDPASEHVHHNHDPIAFEQNRLTAKEIDTPEAVSSLPDDGEPGGTIAAWRRSVVLNEDAPDDILVDLEAECAGDLLGNFTAAQTWVAPFHLDHRCNQLAGGTFRPRATG